MKRTIVISDIHGCYLEFLQLLEKTQYNPAKDSLVIVGDMIDGGKQSLDVVSHILKLKEKHEVIVIRGNHEEMFLNWLDEPFDKHHIYGKNGGWKTIESYCKPHRVYGKNPRTKTVFKQYYAEHISFFRELPLYFETERFIFVHGGVDLTLDDWKCTPKDTFLWIRDEFWKAKNKTGKSIVFGHTPTCFLHEKNGLKSFDIWQSEDGKIAIDGGCSMGGKLHALCIEGNDYTVVSVDKNN